MQRVVARSFALLLLAALCPALAFALSGTYEGKLIPINNDSPITVVVQLEEIGGFISGKVKTSSPLSYNSTIDSGRNVAGYCNMASVLSTRVTLRLWGNCSTTVFEGNYTLYYTQSKSLARGTFRLTRNVAESNKGSGVMGRDSTASVIIACVKANSRCLTACPRGSDAEALCANHCRNKLQACKGKANKLESDAE